MYETTSEKKPIARGRRPSLVELLPSRQKVVPARRAVIRLLSIVLALAGLAAGCSGVDRSGERTASTPKQRVRKGRKVLVTVIDGDTHRRVRAARVQVGSRAGRADRRGVAGVRLAHRAALPVTVSARGYSTRTLRIQFRRTPQASVRIYRPTLQWPLYGANPARTQAQTQIRLRPPFRVIWSRGIGSLIEFPAVVSDGLAYISNFHGTVRAISMRTGKGVWRYDTPHGKMAASPAVVGDELVVHGMDGRVWVLDRWSGRLRWRYDIGSAIESSPLVRDGVDYFGAWNGRVYALDLRRRRLRWSFASGAKITSSAAFAGATLYIGDYGGRVRAVSPRTGHVRWTRSVNGRVYGTPAVSAGRVFVPSSSGDSLTAFSTSGRYLWSRGTGSYVYSSPAVWAGRVFFGSYDGRFYSLSARTGATLWSVATGGPVSGAAVVVDGVAYVGSFAHRILGVGARSGRILFRFPHGHYVPVSGNGHILLLHGYSRLYAVEPRR
jgi:outer membrane protein assembly factor BamB